MTRFFNRLDDKGVDNLVVAIVRQAVQDWRAATHRLKRHPDDLDADNIRKDCERFFRSEWFFDLTGMDGRKVLDQLRMKEMEHRYGRKRRRKRGNSCEGGEGIES